MAPLGSFWQGLSQWLGLCHTSFLANDGKIYMKALYLMVKTMVSCRFSLKPIQWTSNWPPIFRSYLQVPGFSATGRNLLGRCDAKELWRTPNETPGDAAGRVESHQDGATYYACIHTHHNTYTHTCTSYAHHMHMTYATYRAKCLDVFRAMISGILGRWHGSRTYDFPSCFNSGWFRMFGTKRLKYKGFLGTLLHYMDCGHKSFSMFNPIDLQTFFHRVWYQKSRSCALSKGHLFCYTWLSLSCIFCWVPAGHCQLFLSQCLRKPCGFNRRSVIFLLRMPRICRDITWTTSTGPAPALRSLWSWEVRASTNVCGQEQHFPTIFSVMFVHLSRYFGPNAIRGSCLCPGDPQKLGPALRRGGHQPGDGHLLSLGLRGPGAAVWRPRTGARAPLLWRVPALWPGLLWGRAPERGHLEFGRWRWLKIWTIKKNIGFW